MGEPQGDRTAKTAGDTTPHRGVVGLQEARVSRHLTERRRAEDGTWQAWFALDAAWGDCWDRAQAILTPQQVEAIRPDVERIGSCMDAVLDSGKRLLATDQEIAADAQQIAR